MVHVNLQDWLGVFSISDPSDDEVEVGLPLHRLTLDVGRRIFFAIKSTGFCEDAL